MTRDGYGWKPPWHAPKIDKAVLLDEWEEKVLDLLCRGGTYASSVVLAADLYGASEDVQETRALEWNLVELVLADLNEKGLVVYRLGDYDLYTQIRATAAARRLTGTHFVWVSEVFAGTRGNHSKEPSQHPRDGTDFRNYGEIAGYSPVTKEDLIDHCSDCDHFDKHRPQLIELYGTDRV